MEYVLLVPPHSSTVVEYAPTRVSMSLGIYASWWGYEVQVVVQRCVYRDCALCTEWGGQLCDKSNAYMCTNVRPLFVSLKSMLLVKIALLFTLNLV